MLGKTHQLLISEGFMAFTSFSSPSRDWRSAGAAVLAGLAAVAQFGAAGGAFAQERKGIAPHEATATTDCKKEVDLSYLGGSAKCEYYKGIALDKRNAELAAKEREADKRLDRAQGRLNEADQFHRCSMAVISFVNGDGSDGEAGRAGMQKRLDLIKFDIKDPCGSEKRIPKDKRADVPGGPPRDPG